MNYIASYRQVLLLFCPPRSLGRANQHLSVRCTSVQPRSLGEASLPATERVQCKAGPGRWRRFALTLLSKSLSSSPRMPSVDRTCLYSSLTSGEGDSPDPPTHLGRVFLVPEVAVVTVSVSPEEEYYCEQLPFASTGPCVNVSSMLAES